MVTLSKQHQFLLDLDGSPCCRCDSVDVSPTVAKVLTTYVHVKGGTATQVGPIIFGFNGGVDARIVDWIRASLERNAVRKSGILSAIGPGNSRSCIEFFNAMFGEVRIPAVGTPSKGSTELLVRIQPERMTNSVQPLDSRTIAQYGTSSPASWNSGQFKLSIDGLERECAAVKSIESWIIKQGNKLYYTGEDRFPTAQGTHTDSSNLIITMPTTSLGGFQDWMNAITNGSGRSGGSKSGWLQYSPPGSKEPLRFKFQTGLSQIGFSKAGGSPASQFASLELYFDKLAIG